MSSWKGPVLCGEGGGNKEVESSWEIIKYLLCQTIIDNILLLMTRAAHKVYHLHYANHLIVWGGGGIQFTPLSETFNHK